MRLLVIDKDVDAADFGRTLLRRGAKGEAAAASIDRLKQLNPHLDLTKLKAGAVLLVPDLPDFDPAASGNSIGGEAFAGFVKEVDDGWKSAAVRARGAQTRLDDDARALGEALKSPAIRRALEADAELKPQLAAAQAALKADGERAASALQRLQTVQQAAAGELERLKKLFG